MHKWYLAFNILMALLYINCIRSWSPNYPYIIDTVFDYLLL